MNTRPVFGAATVISAAPLNSLHSASAVSTSFPPHSRSRSPLCLLTGITALLLCGAHPSHAETWVPGTGGSWNTAANWSPASIPNGVGAVAIFDSPTAKRDVTLDAAITVGSILINNDSTFTSSNSIASGTTTPPGSLTFDEVGAGPAAITVTGSGTNAYLIPAPMTLTDSLVVTVNNIAGNGTSGALTLSGTMSGPGGFTKQGAGTLTISTANKTYTGPTLFDINTGRTRYSASGSITQSSSVTVMPGAQLDLITTGTYTFGAVLNLNGTGIAAFPGAIRVESNLQVTSATPVVLQSDSSINIQGAASTLTLSGSVSGPGRLTLTTPPNNTDLGTLTLSGNNTYSGGTTIHGGAIVVGGSASASLGTGDVTVESQATTKLTIQTGVTNAIADTAILTLGGGGTGGFVDLGAGVNEVVGGLVLGTVPKGLGTYGSTASSATFKSDEYFSGTGIVTVVPEPGSAVTLLGGLSMLLSLQRFRRRA
ncbi:autotransporter-associated beta strand repeat-containing protein [Verrucomicrobiota bacterium sgz303538]